VRVRRPLVFLLASFLSLVLITALSASEVPEKAPDLDRGRDIFHNGAAADGEEILAAVGVEAFEVRAEVLPCASCHGRDGRGNPEGGISPSDLRWDSLTRKPKPYTEEQLVRAITMGLDAAGEDLDMAMPRYRLSHRDAEDLIAYLRLLGHETVPGVSEEIVRIGTLLPGGKAGWEARAALEAYFDTVNDLGGVFGRKLELAVIPSPPVDLALDASALRQSLEETEPFALVASSVHGHEAEVTGVLEELALPLVGTFHEQAWLPFPPSRYVFYLYGGIEEQARSLVEFAVAQGKNELLIVRGERELYRSAAASAEEQARLADLAVEVVSLESSGPEAEELEAGESEAAMGRNVSVLWLAPGRRLQSLPRDGEALVLVPGQLLDPSMLGAMPVGAGLFAAFPTVPSDLRPAGQSLLQGVRESHALVGNGGPAETTSLASAVLLVAALRAVGREMDREKLVDALESLYRFDTGFTPPLTFGPNRRLGARGAQIVAIDPAAGRFVPAGERVNPR